MPRPSITWLTTDTHFYHGNVAEFCRRPADWMERTLSNWRRLIAPQDLLIHLGDVIFYQYPKLPELMAHAKCRRVLVMGNHDRKTQGWYMRNGFDFVCDSFRIGDVLFSHKPCEHLPADAAINIHGHWHNRPHDDDFVYPEWYRKVRHHLVSLEDANYLPVNLEKMLAVNPQRL